jgi:phospholipase A2
LSPSLALASFLISISLSFPGGSENPDDEYHRTAQNSWVQRMITSLFSDSSLFNTREGRAGKVHNFMLGLNLNTNMPFSTFGDFMYQNSCASVEDEVDAVTGQMSNLAIQEFWM